jgi:hypothetical protein
MKYNLDTLLNLITPNCKIIIVDKVTEGAACTSLLAKEYIDNNDSLLIANSDQYIRDFICIDDASICRRSCTNKDL